MTEFAVPRPSSIRASVLANVFSALVWCGAANAQAHHASAPAVTPAAALQRLVDGNLRFAAGKPTHPHQNLERRKQLSAGQHPFATIVGCSDSRVPSELVFDQGLGDLFVVRVAGNVCADDDLGSVEYAVNHLGTTLVLVTGHESCGAVTSALLPDSIRAQEAAGIQTLLAHVAPSLTDINRALPQSEQVHRGVEANVRRSVAMLRDAPELKARIASGSLNIVGSVYDLETGRVRILK